MTSTNHDTELDLSAIEHLDFEIPCCSNRCREEWHLGEHPADWAVFKTCGCSDNICDRGVRFTQGLMASGAFIRCGLCGTSPIRWTKLIPIR